MLRWKCKPQNSFIGKNAKNKSEIGILEKKLIDQQNTIEGAKTVLIEKQQELDSLKNQLKDISRQIDNNCRKLCHKREKLQGITEIVSNVSATISSKQKQNWIQPMKIYLKKQNVFDEMRHTKFVKLSMGVQRQTPNQR